jgi:hypothetical protein
MTQVRADACDPRHIEIQAIDSTSEFFKSAMREAGVPAGHLFDHLVGAAE